MNGTKAKPRPLMTEGTSIREDTWVSSGSGAAATYKLKSIKLLFDKSLLNGKPVKKLFH